MPAMGLTFCAVALISIIQVQGFAIPQNFGDLPIDCPFHREPAGLGHIKDTVEGTLTQSGNFEFSKIPGNTLQSVQDYASLVYNPYDSENVQGFPEYQPEVNYNQWQQPDFYPTENEEGYASILPYYENSGENTFSILPYYEEGTQGNNINYGYEQEEPICQEAVQVIESCDLDPIHQAALEEIDEAEENARNQIDVARALTDNEISTEEVGFKRNLFSFFKPEKMIAMPMKAATMGLQIVADGLKPVEKQADVKKVQNKINNFGWNSPQSKNEVAVKAQEACSLAVDENLRFQLDLANQEEQQCIGTAEYRFLQTTNNARYYINENRGRFETKKEENIQQLNSCTRERQFENCQQEVGILKEVPTDFATVVNDHLAKVSDAEELLKQELTVCKANGKTRQEIHREEAAISRSEC